MKRVFTTALACAVAFSLAGAAAAQDDPAPIDQPAVEEPSVDPAPDPATDPAPADTPVGTSGEAEAPAASDSITVTGCLSGSEGNWKLTSASTMPATPATPADPGAPGAGATPADPAAPAEPAGTTYKLSAASDDELKNHVGHKIEVTGTVDESAMASGDASDRPIGTAGADADAHAKKLNVASVRMVSGSCE